MFRHPFREYLICQNQSICFCNHHCMLNGENQFRNFVEIKHFLFQKGYYPLVYKIYEYIKIFQKDCQCILYLKLGIDLELALRCIL